MRVAFAVVGLAVLALALVGFLAWGNFTSAPPGPAPAYRSASPSTGTPFPGDLDRRLETLESRLTQIALRLVEKDGR